MGKFLVDVFDLIQQPMWKEIKRPFWVKACFEKAIFRL
jgi:hypothetical protein